MLPEQSLRAVNAEKSFSVYITSGYRCSMWVARRHEFSDTAALRKRLVL